MRVVILVLALIVIFVLVGWITFSDGPGRSSVNIETNEIRQDTGEVLHKGSELLQDAEKEVAPVTGSEVDTNSEPPTSDVVR